MESDVILIHLDPLRHLKRKKWKDFCGQGKRTILVVVVLMMLRLAILGFLVVISVSIKVDSYY